MRRFADLQEYYVSVSYGFVTDRSVIAALEAAVHRVLDHLAGELADLGLRQAEVNLLAQLRPGVARASAIWQRRRASDPPPSPASSTAT